MGRFYQRSTIEMIIGSVKTYVLLRLITVSSLDNERVPAAHRLPLAVHKSNEMLVERVKIFVCDVKRT